MNSLYICAHCGIGCTRRDALVRHVRIKHLPHERLNCHLCSKTYVRKEDLKRHQQFEHHILEGFECEPNEIDEIYFECDTCKKTFRDKRYLRNHMVVHQALPNRICSYCDERFKYNRNLLRHIRYFHLNENKNSKSNENTRFRCGSCNRNFPKKKAILRHYNEVHDFSIEVANFEFSSVDEFEKWKLNMQCQTITQFYSIDSWRNNEDKSTVRVYQCNRTSEYVRKKKEKDRKTFPRWNGSKKTSHYCPAQIKLKIKFDGTCLVEFRKTHFGHEVGKTELRYVNVPGVNYPSRAKNLKLSLAAAFDTLSSEFWTSDTKVS